MLARIFPTTKLRKFSARQLNFVAKLLTNLFIWKTKSSCYYLDTFCSTKAKQNFFRWNVLRARLRFKDKAELLFELLKDELNIECSTVKGRLTELTTIRNNLAHGDAVFDISTATLHFGHRKGEYTVGDSFKGEIDAKVQSVDTFLSDLLKDQRFAEANS